MTHRWNGAVLLLHWAPATRLTVTMETRQDPEERAEWRFRLVRRLYEGGFSREHVLEMLVFLDWIMALPEEVERRYNERIEEYEKERAMEYVTSWERNGIKKGIREGALQTARKAVLDVLETRFGAVEPSIAEVVNGTEDVDALWQMHRRAVVVIGPDQVLQDPA